MKIYKFTHRSQYGDKVDFICHQQKNSVPSDFYIFHMYLYINDRYIDKLPNFLAFSYSDLEEQCQTYLKTIE